MSFWRSNGRFGLNIVVTFGVCPKCFVPLHKIYSCDMAHVVTISDAALVKAAGEGFDAFVGVFVDAILDSIGGELNAQTMSMLNSDQITLLAWHILHEEVMDGGFVQLIHNGYGGFIYLNPFARVIGDWGLADLKRVIRKTHQLYKEHHEGIEKECDDDEFMAMFEKYPCFDDYDDEFVENEEKWTCMIASYIDENIDKFVKVV